MKVEYLSISSAMQFTRCAEQYRLRKTLGPMAPGIAAVRGRGVDSSANVNMHQKAKTRVDLAVEELEAVAADEIEASFHGQILFTDEERKLGAVKVKGQVKDQAVQIVNVYATDLAPLIQPSLLPNGDPAVQAKIRAELPAAGLTLEGILDLIDEEAVIRDLKTSGKAPVKNRAENSAQLTMYALLRRALTAEEYSKLALDTIVLTDGRHVKPRKPKKPRKPRKGDQLPLVDDMPPAPIPVVEGKVEKKCYVAPTQTTERGPEEQLSMVERLVTIKDAIEKEIFIPTDPESWVCSQRFCGFYNVCRYVQKGAQRPTS